MVMKLTRPSASSFLALSTTRFSWCSSACRPPTAQGVRATSFLVYFFFHSKPIQYLSEESDGAWGEAVLGPHLLGWAEGHGDGLHTLGCHHQLLVATTLLSLPNSRRDFPKEMFPSWILEFLFSLCFLINGPTRKWGEHCVWLFLNLDFCVFYYVLTTFYSLHFTLQS